MKQFLRTLVVPVVVVDVVVVEGVNLNGTVTVTVTVLVTITGVVWVMQACVCLFLTAQKVTNQISRDNIFLSFLFFVCQCMS